ncbi:MAG TPA: hypothetical protein VFX50_07420, partial [Gemmatimonadales bacterium]|nr:hypothetical protein [Gemmatimonadales bacterium]
LAARPGRVDLAVEIPLPDAGARRRLLDIYGRGLDLTLSDVEGIVGRTEGVTASFVKELLRKAALAALDAGRQRVTDADVHGALDELLTDSAALTRTLLGAGGDEPPPPSRQWLGRFPGSGGGGWTSYDSSGVAEP